MSGQPLDLDVWTHAHRQTRDAYGRSWCETCGLRWPCLVEEVLDEVRRLRDGRARLLEVADAAQRLVYFWRQGATKREIGLLVDTLDAAIAVLEENDG